MLRKLYYRLCFGIVYILILSYASISVGQIRLIHVSMHACGWPDSRLTRRIWGFEYIGSKFRI
jgi:hypothetical protein